MNWQKIYATNSLPQAEIVRSLLQNFGIQAVIINKRESVYNLFGEAEVHVPREHVIRAIQLLKHELETERFD